MTGPGLAWTMWPVTPKSSSFFLSVCALASSSSRVRLSSEAGGAWRSPTDGSWKARAPPLPKSKVSCHASPFSTSEALSLAGSLTTRRGGISGLVGLDRGIEAGGAADRDAGPAVFLPRKKGRPESLSPAARDMTWSDTRVMNSTATGMTARRMIQVPTLPTETRRASDTAQPRTPPLWIRCSDSVSDMRVRIPVTLIRRRPRPAAAGQPVTMRERMKAEAP